MPLELVLPATDLVFCFLFFFQKQFFGAYIAGREFCPKTNEKEEKNNTKCWVEFSYDGGYIFKKGVVPSELVQEEGHS